MTVRLTWTPGTAATSQTIQYRLVGATTWTTQTTINNNTTSTYQFVIADGNYEFRVLNSCIKCLCPNGSAPDGNGNCSTQEVIPATELGTPTPVTRTPFSVYGNEGTLVHTNLSPTGPTTRLTIDPPYFWIRQNIPNFWDSNIYSNQDRQQLDLNNGPVNRLAVWGVALDSNGVPYNNYTIAPRGNTSVSDIPPLDVWIGFDVCINVPATRTYYVAIAADNYYRFFLDGTLVLSDERINETAIFNYLHIYPLVITAGTHIVRLQGINDYGEAAFACEIFDLENRGSLSVVDFLNQQTNYNNLNVIFTTRNVTQFTSNIFSCPPDYTLVNPGCSGAVCTKGTTVACTDQPSPSNVVTVIAPTCPAPVMLNYTLTSI